VLNRSALILRYKQPFVDWINAVDPSPNSHTLTLADVNQEQTVYLIEVEDEKGLAKWLLRNHRQLFEEELNGWYTDPKLWPRDRSLKVLKGWCLELTRSGGHLDTWDHESHKEVRRAPQVHPGVPTGVPC
jgi:hypothetical protein